MLMYTKYPSIDQFRTVVTYVKSHSEPDEVTIIKFQGTVKLHGTNGGIGWDGSNIIVQSRNRPITVTDDNAGFAKFIDGCKGEIKELMSNISVVTDTVVNPNNTLFIYGEWCGQGIQKNVALSDLKPMFVIFGASYCTKGKDENTCYSWIDHTVLETIKLDKLNSKRIYHNYQFPHWEHTIVFKQPELGIVQNELALLTEAVEAECPVGKYFGVKGVGEGIVWLGKYVGQDGRVHHLRFKVKGDKHSVCKVKTLAAVDIEKIKGIQEFVSYAVTDKRMEQGYDELFTKRDIVPSTKDIGTFVKWVSSDVLKEESDTMVENNIKIKDIGKTLSTTARAWIQRKLTELAFTDCQQKK